MSSRRPAASSGRASPGATGRRRQRPGRPFPAVGDWVAIDARDDGASVHALLPRRTTRRSATTPGLRSIGQVVAANVDVVFVVASLNQDLNLRRLERYLAFAWESGAAPVVVLSKADLGERSRRRRSPTSRRVAFGVPILTVSAIDGRGHRCDPRPASARARTVAFVGLVGRREVDPGQRPGRRGARRGPGDPRGRRPRPPHDARRQLHRMPDGGLILDTPGMRELGLWDADAGLERSFARHRRPCRRAAASPIAATTASRAAPSWPRSPTATSTRAGSTAGASSSARRATSSVGRMPLRPGRGAPQWKAISKSVGKHMDAKYGTETWR